MTGRLCHPAPSHSRRRSVGGPALLAGIVAVFFSAALEAHEIGTTRVAVTFQEGRTYDVEIVTDAAALIDKLEASSGGTSPGSASPAQLRSLLAHFDETFRQRVTVTFDGPIAGGATFELPTITAHLTAGASGTVDSSLYGTSYDDPGLTFTAVVSSIIGDISAPTSCFPNPSPVLTSTTVG